MPELMLPDASLHYSIAGTGKPLLFCSATATHGDVWALRQTDDLSRDFTVITFDQRGTGQSRTDALDFSIDRLADDAAALLAHANAGPAVICGHSNGGRVALSLAIRYPHLVDRLILMSSGGVGSGSGIPISVCKGMAELGYLPWLRDQAIHLGFTKAFAAEQAADMEAFLAVRLADPPTIETYLRHVVGRQAFDCAARIAEIAIPTLLLVGDDEDHDAQGGKTHRQHALELARLIRGSRLVTLEGQAHYYYFSDPARTNGLIREFALR
jgi:pimeloyl-ACP methyl ester carboxylesterase